MIGIKVLEVELRKGTNFLEENPEAKTVYETLREELAAGVARQLQAGTEGGHATKTVGLNSTGIEPGQPDNMARLILDHYVSGLIRFRDPQEQTHLQPGMAKDLRDLSQSLVVMRRRAGRVLSKLPPGPRGALAVGQWDRETVKLTKELSERGLLPKSAGKWNVVDEIIWGFLKSLKQITGRYHYPEVAELVMLCLDDPKDRHNIASLKMIVQRRKPREIQFRQALTEFGKQEEPISRPARPRSSPQKETRKR